MKKVIVVTANHPQSVEQLNDHLKEGWQIEGQLILPNSDVHYIVRLIEFDLPDEVPSKKSGKGGPQQRGYASYPPNAELEPEKNISCYGDAECPD